jgi:hypothetical protein
MYRRTGVARLQFDYLTEARKFEATQQCLIRLPYVAPASFSALGFALEDRKVAFLA